MKQNNLFEKGFLIIIVLKNIHITTIFHHFSLKKLSNLTCFLIKFQKYLLYKFNDWIESLGAEKNLIRHTSKVKDEVRLQKIEEKDKQFFIEKLIYEIEKKNS